MKRLFAAAGFAALLCLPLLNVAPVAAATTVKISLSCYGHPEKTTIKNTGATAFKIKTVGSTYRPYSFEPFTVNKTLSPGKSITYQTGYSASSNVLTHDYIYNDNGQDGARVATTVGTYTKHC